MSRMLFTWEFWREVEKWKSGAVERRKGGDGEEERRERWREGGETKEEERRVGLSYITITIRSSAMQINITHQKIRKSFFRDKDRLFAVPQGKAIQRHSTANREVTNLREKKTRHTLWHRTRVCCAIEEFPPPPPRLLLPPSMHTQTRTPMCTYIKTHTCS